jgi:hypothetical protein
VSVKGKFTPDMLKPAPVSVPALMVSGAVPEEVSVTDSGVAAVLSVTLPNAMLLVLRLRLGAAVTGGGVLAFTSRAKVLESVPEVAVRVAVCAVVTDALVAEKATLVVLAGTVTVAGKVTAALLLERLTLTPPIPAVALRFTVQESLLPPVIEALVQASALSVAGELNDTVDPHPDRNKTALQHKIASHPTCLNSQMENRLRLVAREEFTDELSWQVNGVNRISFVPGLIRRMDLNVIDFPN